MRLDPLGLLGGVLTGLLLLLLFPPFNFAFAAPVALAPLLYAIHHDPRSGRRFLWGWIAGIIFWGGCCYWIQGVLARHGGLSTALSILALVLFSLAKGLHLGVFALLSGPLMRRPWALPAIPLLWTGLERTHANLGFTWLQLGNAGIDMAVPLRLAPWVGVYGLSFLFASLATALALVLLRRPRRWLIGLAPAALILILPPVEIPAPPKQAAVSLQPNIADRDNWPRAEFEKLLRRSAVATLQQALEAPSGKPALLLWPESPAPFYYYADSEFRDTMAGLARTAGAPFLFGSVATATGGEPLNSAIALESNGRLASRYDKVHLVPFGEFVPPLFNWIGKVSAEAGNYQAGERIVVHSFENGYVGAFICYESAFGDHVRRFAAQGAQLLVNLTNDGYFARTAARPQHLALLRMRAVENRRWILRPANDGTTAAISPAGSVREAFPPFEARAGLLHFDWIGQRTFYTEHGDWFAWLALGLGLAAALSTRLY